MTPIHLDIETRSAINLAKVGAHNYAADPSTEVLCVCYQVHGSAGVKVWLPGQPAPVFPAGYTLIAHNAGFESQIMTQILGPRHGFVLPKKYICTMAMCAHNGYPLGLEAAATALRLDVRKDSEGAFLMRRMCKPLGKNVDIDSEAYKGDLQRLVQYCIQDVVVEAEIFDRLKITEFEQRVYEVDQLINNRGVLIDTESVAAIIKAINLAIQDLTNELQTITGGEVGTPGQVQAIRNWLSARGVDLPDLRAETVDKWINVTNNNGFIPPECLRVLQIRQAASLSSIKKYPAMILSAGKDRRARGLFLYCGAMSTGRWSGRRIQLQNLPRLTLKDDEVLTAIDLFKRCDIDALQLMIGDPIDVAKELLRPMIYSDRGLVVGDWSSIELRVAAWLAGQSDLVQELRDGIDVYKSMASVIYGLPMAEVLKDQRQVGKAAVLGCGYGLGWRTFHSTLTRFGIDATEELAERAVNAFRLKNGEIKSIWYALSDAALLAFDSGKVQKVGRYLKFAFKRGTLAMRLPSGRLLQYHEIKCIEGKFGRELTCASFDPTKGNGRKKLYGGLFFENACQAVARDLLAETLVRGTDAGYEIIASVHDEILVEGTDDVAGVKACMETLPDWAEGLPVKADVFSCAGAGNRYTK